MKKYLLLANGEVFEGTSIGAQGECIGEVVFTTGMGSYMETLTDPSYYGQIITQTFPLIGNYGSITADSESYAPGCKGYIVRELCDNGSNYRKEGELNDYLISRDIVGICDIDTRKLTKIIRESGVMNGMITSSLDDKDRKIELIKKFKVEQAPKNTTAKECITYGDGDKKVALIDYGAKNNIIKELVKRGCKVTVMPCTMTAEEILSSKPDGIMLSNGGGNPADCIFEIEQLKKINEHKIPTFGICLGHQLMALACGGKTQKLKYGHRGANQPVKDLVTGRVFITSQNHGYAVESDSLEGRATARMMNLNDETCEGMDYLNMPCMTVQFHPEACGGPLDTMFIFDKFIEMMEDTNA